MYWSKGGCIYFVVCSYNNDVLWKGGTKPIFLEEVSSFYVVLHAGRYKGVGAVHNQNYGSSKPLCDYIVTKNKGPPNSFPLL